MIIASFTTIPSRLEKGLPSRCIKTLQAQERPADLILINIPLLSRKGVAYDTSAAERLQQKGVIVNWVDMDYGPITKLFGTLAYIEKHQIKNARIILVDDDVEYKPWAFRRLIDEGGRASGFVSRDPVYNSWGRIINTKWLNRGGGETALLETYAGVIYDADLFLPYSQMREWYMELPAMCHNADDIVIAEWVHRKGVKLNRLALTNDSVSHDADGTEQLRDINVFGTNNIMVLQYFADNTIWRWILWILALVCIVAAVIVYMWTSKGGMLFPGLRSYKRNG
jgi:hypothetical protein